METHSPLHRARHFRFSRPLTVLIVTATATIAAIFVALCCIGYSQHRYCQEQQERLLYAEIRYQARFHSTLTGNEKTLQGLVSSGILSEPLTCPQGGKYSVVDNGDGTITIQCSLPQHQMWHGFSREGLRSRIHPGSSRQE